MSDVTIINIRTSGKLKQDAQEVAKELGLNLSSILNAYLHQLVRTRKVAFDLTEIPTAQMRSMMASSAADKKNNDVSPVFQSGEDALTWLHDAQS